MLEIKEDQPFQEKVWIVQRIGWGMLILFLGLAAVGLTGPSRITRITEEKGGHRLEYPRFARMDTAFEMIVAPASGEKVFFSREILRRAAIQNVMPLPLRGEAEAGGMSFRFGNGGQGEIHMDWKPKEAGWTKGKVMIGEPPVEFDLKQFVFF